MITKPVDNIEGLNDNKELFEKQKIKVVYTGNLKIDRLNTLEVISSVLLNNPDLETRFIFDIYSATDIPDAIRAKLSKSIHLCGTIPLQEVSKVQKSADMLLLIEDITGENQHTARLSFSTKITDYLCQGKCILAIGNTDIASMEYFKSENCALCASDIVSIEEKLRLVLDSPEILLIMGKNALNVARKNHSRK